jgi:ribosome-associated heat shock protein Hsp15
VRLDKWLWTARLFKTRSAATEAVSGGRVHVNGAAAKPSREVRPGDQLQISGPSGRTVIVRGAAERRVAPRETGSLWEETAASLSERERQRDLRRLSPTVAGPGGRPTKRDRRRYDQTRRGGAGPQAG